MVSGMCYAQYSNHQLYQAYLNKEMSVWEEYIVSAKWENLSLDAQKQLLNYEYGFTAFMLTVDTDKAREFIALFEKHRGTKYSDEALDLFEKAMAELKGE